MEKYTMNYYISDLHLFHETRLGLMKDRLVVWMKCMIQLRNAGTVK